MVVHCVDGAFLEKRQQIDQRAVHVPLVDAGNRPLNPRRQAGREGAILRLEIEERDAKLLEVIRTVSATDGFARSPLRDAELSSAPLAGRG